VSYPHLVVTIPLPPRCLRANASTSASRGAAIGRRKATAKARGDAKLATLAALDGKAAPKWQSVNVAAEFHLGPQGRHCDSANLIAWLKASADGIQDALGIDDRHFHWLYQSQLYGRESRERKVVIWLTPKEHP
jgi:crossover junction endodeoxyribonuclease RusA